MNADVVVHAYGTTPVDARTAANAEDVEVQIGDVRIWLPRPVAEQLHALLGQALGGAR